MNMEMPKKIEKDNVITILKETKDFNNPVVQGWLNQKEDEVSKEGTASARILYNIELADLFTQVDMNKAWEAIKEVLSELDMERSLSDGEKKELYGILYKKMDEVGYPKDDSTVGTDPKIDYYTKE